MKELNDKELILINGGSDEAEGIGNWYGGILYDIATDYIPQAILLDKCLKLGAARSFLRSLFIW